MATKALRGLPTLLVGLLVVSVLFTAYTARQAFGAGGPANKVSGSGDDLESTSEDEAPIAVLSEQFKVSTPEDLIIQVSSECSILTSLLTGEETGDDATDPAFAFGQVKFFVSVDGKRVPVSTNDTPEAIDEHGTSDTDDFGEVVFCNRAYQRSVTDSEDPADGVDTQDDFIRTRSANAFNWLALNVGSAYDDPANGNNILDVILWAEFDQDNAAGSAPCNDAGPDNNQAPFGADCALALIGSRTMIIEPTKTANGEVVSPGDVPTTPAPPANTATPSPRKSTK